MVVLSVAVVVVVVALFGTVAYGVYAGLNTHQVTTPGKAGAIVSGTAARAALGVATDSASTSRNTAAAAPIGSTAIAQPAPEYFPGGPPFADGGVGADGISAWGVAFREVADPTAQPDAALIKAAYQDAEKRINDLASATGVKAGKLVAMTDHTINQPYFKPCIESSGGPALGKPVPGAAAGEPGATGSGSAPGATTIAPVPPQVAPCQANGSNYLVVWVSVRHAIG
jgi:hypothetical protein